MNTNLPGAIVLLFLLAVPAAQAQINRCLDAGGKVIAYGNECPPGTRPDATGIRSPTATTPAPAAPAARTAAEQEADFRKRRAETQAAQEKADKASADTTARIQACERARSYLVTLQSGQRITRLDPKTGERIVLEDADRAAEAAAAQRTIASNCKVS